MNWYLVFTKPNEEAKVERQFTDAKIEHLYPKIRTRRLRMRKLISVTEPLFPRYMFIRIDLEEKFRLIKYTRGVAGFVDFGYGPVPVDENIVRGIKEREKNGYIQANNNNRRYRKNDLLRIKKGILKDIDVIFDGYLSGEERVSLLINNVSSNIKLNINKLYL
jgi:transcriptional antiterminator RfaH